MPKLKTFHLSIIIAGIFYLGVFSFVSASAVDGTISAVNKYAWSENAGWINFGTTDGNIHVTDSVLTGYAWSENLGWISLNCSNNASCAAVDYKVSNTAYGNLSGFAWGENAGWINFSPTDGGVSISDSGEFSGYAWTENTGWISFNCSDKSTCAAVDYKITTDWRPPSIRAIPPSPNPNPATTYIGGGGARLASPVTPSQPETAVPLSLQDQIQRIQSLINQLQSQIQSFNQPATPPSITPPTSGPSTSSLTPAPIIFNQNLIQNNIVQDVKSLQQFLNQNSFNVASTGPGAPGKETNIFGPLTKAALIKFQEAHSEQILKPLGLTKGTGYLGPSTRAFINSLK